MEAIMSGVGAFMQLTRATANMVVTESRWEDLVPM